ncbi:MAG: DUF2283 domain-containing protein [Deltaproteobacteria bacterium]|nr:DUF2283 domain-containing protein [Deltaproteobacteria bacterium]
MENKAIKIWYDSEGDYLEVMFENKPGYFRETDNDLVMEKVDAAGHVLGFSIQQVSDIKQKPLEATLVQAS